MPRFDQNPRYQALNDEFDAVFSALVAFQEQEYARRRQYWQGLPSHELQRLDSGTKRDVVKNLLPNSETKAWDEIPNMPQVWATYTCDAYNKGGDHPGFILRAEVIFDEGDGRGEKVFRREKYYGPKEDRKFNDYRTRSPELVA